MSEGGDSRTDGHRQDENQKPKPQFTDNQRNSIISDAPSHEYMVEVIRQHLPIDRRAVLLEMVQAGTEILPQFSQVDLPHSPRDEGPTRPK